MAWICDKNGQRKCEVKKLSYNGVFMDVSSITVTVESPAPIAFAIGDYIDWDYDGLRYTLDAAAGVEKQARKNSIGTAFVYENLVFLSPLKAADNVDFLDVVIGNTIDFMTNTEFSFYGTAWDYAKRLEANLCRLYGEGSWRVRIWTEGVCYDTAPADLDTGAWENKLVDVSGIKCLGGFQQIYDLWGCAYVFSVVNGVNYVDFYDDFELCAKAWEQGGDAKIFAYGKGNGLYKIRYTQDADHVLVTRLRAYGSGDNLPANYYLNSPDYHFDGNESSELAISRLMLPASEWTKDGVRSPSNAYLEQNTDLYGVREGVVCWDGSDPELGEIKPSIQGLTIQELLNRMSSGDAYRPVEAKWPDTSQRIDKIITGAAPTDNGAVAESGYDGYDFTVVEAHGVFSANELSAARVYSIVDFGDLTMATIPSVSHLADYRVVPTSENVKVASFDVPASVIGLITDVNAYITPYINGVKVDDATIPCIVSSEVIFREVSGVEYTKRYYIHLLDANSAAVVFSTMRTGAVTFKIQANITYSGQTSQTTVLRNEYAVNFNLLRGNKAIDKFFFVTIPQIGFDLSAAMTGSAKLCMRSGYNQPREFPIVASFVRYDSATDTWYLRCKRVADQSTSTYFPNSDAVIAAGDEYYFTGIAMPPLYVEIAARKLLVAATAWLNLHSKPRMLSAVDVDNKIMATEGIVLKEGMSLPISDADLDVTPDSQESRVIDNIRIEEGANAIRTFSITLRDKKEKSSLDAAIRGATSNFATNSSVSEAVSAVESRDHGGLSGRDMPNQHPISAITGLEDALAVLQFFEEDGSGNVKLKDEYGGLWASGFVSAGGLGSGGSSGGIDIDRMWQSLKNEIADSHASDEIAPVHIPDLSWTKITSGKPTTLAEYGIADAYTKAQVDNLIAGIDVSGSVLPLSEAIAGLSGRVSSLEDWMLHPVLAEAYVNLLNVDEINLAGANLATSLSDLFTAISNEVSNRNAAIANAINALDSATEAVPNGYFLTGVTITNGKITGRTQDNSISGSAATLSVVNKTAWGRTYWTSGGVPDNVSGDMSSVGSISMSGSISGATTITASSLIKTNGYLQGKRLVLDDGVFLEYDSASRGVKLVGAGLWTESYVTAGGVGTSGGGGGGGADLSSVWESMQDASVDYGNWKINTVHFPTLNASDGLTASYGAVSGSGSSMTTTLNIGITSLAMSKVSGLQTALAGKQNAISDLATIRSNAALGAEAYNTSVALSNGIAAASARISSLEDMLFRPAFAEAYIGLLGTEEINLGGLILTADTLFSAFGYSGGAFSLTIGGVSRSLAFTKSSIGLGNVENTALSSWAGTQNITTLGTITTGVWHGGKIANDYLANTTVGVGNATISLGGSASLTQIGIPGWAQKASLAFTDMPAMYIGNARVQSSAQTAQDVGGLGNITASGFLKGSRLYLADDVYLEYDSTTQGIKIVNAGLWTESYVTAGGTNASSGGGGGDGASLLQVWRSLTNNPQLVDADITSTLEIDLAHLPIGNVSSGNSGLVTGGAVYSAINSAISSAIKYQGITTTALADGSTTNPIAIDGASYTAKKGDEVIYGGKEFLYTGSKWQQLGDEESWALKTVTITGTGYLTGGGSLESSRTIDIAASVKTKIDNGATAYSWGDHRDAGYFLAANFTADNIKSTLGTTAVNRAMADASGNNISSTYATITALNGKQDTISDLTTIRSNAALGADVYNSMISVAGSLAGLSSRVASIEEWFFHPALAETYISLLNVDEINLGGNDLATSLSSLNTAIADEVTNRNTAITNAIDSLDSATEAVSSGYFLTGVTIVNGKITSRAQSNSISGSAARLAGDSAYSIWGVEYWSSGVPKSVTGRPGLYIGTTQVQTSGGTQDLNGIGAVNASGLATIAGGIKLTTTKKIYFGDNEHFLELDSNGFHFSHGVYSDGFMTAGGVGSSGDAGGIDLDRVWESLTNNTDKPNVKINLAHIPDITTAKITDFPATWAWDAITGKPDTIAGYGITNAYTKAEVDAKVAGIDVTGQMLPLSEGMASVGSRIASLEEWASSPVADEAHIVLLDTEEINLGGLVLTGGSGGYVSVNGTELFSQLSSSGATITGVIGGRSRSVTLAGIPNSSLANSSITINGTAVSLGGTRTITLAQIIGSSTIGSASVPVWYNGSSLTAVTASSMFPAPSSSAGANLSLTIAGQTRSLTLYATYDSEGNNIATRASGAELSMASELTAVASRVSSLEEWLTMPMLGETTIDLLNVREINGVDAQFSGAMKVTGRTTLSDALEVSGATSLGDALNVAGLITAASGIKLSTTKKLWFGNSYYIELDSSNRLHTNASFYSDGFVAAGGVGSGGSGGGGMIDTVYNESDFESTAGSFNEFTTNETFNAYAITSLNVRLLQLEGETHVNSVNSISGNVNLVGGNNISITKSGRNITISSTGGGSSSGTEWYNIKLKMRNDDEKPRNITSNQLYVYIENYNSALTDNTQYRFLLMRWRRGNGEASKANSWHVPFFSSSIVNEVSGDMAWWSVIGQLTDFWHDGGYGWDDVINYKRYGYTGGSRKYCFANNKNKKIRFGCALYKNNGNATRPWDRVSNIIYTELYMDQRGVITMSFKP